MELPSSCAYLGPFEDPSWPSASFLIAWCVTEADPTILVLDDQSMDGCGFRPRAGSLNAFYKDVGSLALWEVAPAVAGRPRLLDTIRACDDG